MPEDYYKDGYYYYFKLRKGDWKVVKLCDGRFEMDAGLYTSVEDLIEQCGIQNVIRIPLPEDLK